MKYSTTFSEMSDIFALIAKADDKIGKYICAETDYATASSEYTNSNYAPAKASEMSKAYDLMTKARRAMNACFARLLVAFQADSNDFNDQNLRDLAKRDYEPYRFLYAAKREAMRLAKYIEL